VKIINNENFSNNFFQIGRRTLRRLLAFLTFQIDLRYAFTIIATEGRRKAY
jgi:hypothetical protein